MTIRILEHDGSVSNTIPLCDIDHVEISTLNYFGEKAHNLYLVLKKGDSAFFHLLTYQSQQNRDLDEKQLSGLLLSQENKSSAALEVVLELMPSAAPDSSGEACATV